MNTVNLGPEHRHEELIKLCFEGCKHMTTLSGVAIGFLLTVYQYQVTHMNLPAVLPVGAIKFVGYALFGGCILVSLFGLLLSLGNFKATKSKTIAMAAFAVAVGLFGL